MLGQFKEAQQFCHYSNHVYTCAQDHDYETYTIGGHISVFKVEVKQRTLSTQPKLEIVGLSSRMCKRIVLKRKQHIACDRIQNQVDTNYKL